LCLLVALLNLFHSLNMSFVPGTPFVIKHPGVYADLGKRTSDLLNKEFPTTSFAEIKVKPSIEGLAPEVTLTKGKDGNLAGKLGVKYNLANPRGVQLSVTTDTAKNVKLEAVAENTVTQGLKATVGYDFHKTSLDLEYKHDYFTVSTGLDSSASSTNARGSFVVGKDGFAAGAFTEYNVATGHRNALNGTASYTDLDSVATVFARQSTNIVGATYYRRATDRVAVGVEGVYGWKSGKPTITLGGAYDVDVNTTVKAKVDSDGRVGLSYAQRFNRFTRVILGASVNTQNASSGHQFGASVALNN